MLVHALQEAAAAPLHVPTAHDTQADAVVADVPPAEYEPAAHACVVPDDWPDRQ